MASLSDLLRSVETLGPQLESITSVLKHASDANLSETTTNLGSASAALSRLLYFLHTASSLRRNSLPASIAARTNGELQSLIAQIFCALAITEGVSLEGSHNSDVALAELKAFQESRVSPMMREFSRVKEDALARVSRCEKEVEVANSNLENAQSLLEGNTVTVAATSKHLDAVQCHINTMSSQLDSYGVRMRELERRKANAKERRQVSSSSRAIGFFSIFSPVLAPVAAAAAVFASRATDSELRRLGNQMEALRRQIAGLSPNLIETALRDLNVEHEGLQCTLSSATVHVSTLAKTRESLVAQMADLESVNKRLSDICSDVALVQISIAETAAKVRDTATSAGHVKSLWAQAVSTMSRMEWEDGRNWVCGVARSSLYLMAGNEMAEMRRVLDACGEAVMHDEGIESGGEMEVDLGEVQDGDDDSTDGEDHTSFSTSKRFCFDAIKSSDPPDHEMVPEYAQYLVNLDSVLEAIEETDEDEESDEELVKVSVKTVEVIREKGSRVKDVEVAQFKMETGGDFSQ